MAVLMSLLSALIACTPAEFRALIEFFPRQLWLEAGGKMEWALDHIVAMAAPLVGRAVRALQDAPPLGGTAAVAQSFDFGSGRYLVQPEGRPSDERVPVEPRALCAEGARAPAEHQDVSELLRCLIEVLALHYSQPHYTACLANMLRAAPMRLLLAHAEVRELVRSRMPHRLEARRPNAPQPPDERALQITFLKECAAAGAPFSSKDLRHALALEQRALTHGEVLLLGVDVLSCKALVDLAPSLAIPAFGYRILCAEPAFARTLPQADLLRISQLAAADEAHWPVCRSVIAVVEPAAALRIAIALFKHSCEPPDLDLLKRAYLAVDEFTRKQVWLPTELASVWATMGPQIQASIIDVAWPQTWPPLSSTAA
jgi:hypothetical protein